MRILVLSLAVLPLLGCERRGQLREWQPSDHQPPPAVAPEGQGEAEEGGDATARAAKTLWSMKCAQCHGVDGRGDGSGKPPGANMPDMTTAAFQEARSDAQLLEVIAKGRNMMPAFGQELTEAGMAALLGHIRTLKQ